MNARLAFRHAALHAGMEDDVKAAFGSDMEFDFKWEPTSVLVPSLDQELQKCDALAGGELKFDFYRKTPLIDDDSQRSTSDEISSSGHPHPPPSVSTSQLNAVMQDENIKDSSYSLKTPPHPRFTVFNSQITPSREKPSSVGSRSPSPSRPRADLDVPYLSSRTSSPLVLSPFTTPLKDHNVKCSGWTNCKPCTEVVDVNDVNAQSALATLYPEDRDEPIERFCSGHRNTILMESGFLSRKVKDKWVEFKDWVPPYLHPVTQIDLRRTMKMPPTEGDRPGYLYTYEIRDRKNPDSERIYFRVGYASKLSRRTHWENDCPSKEPIVCGYWPWPEQDNDADVMAPRPQGRFCHRVKKLVSLELADLVVNKQHLDLKFPEVEKTSDAIKAVSPGLESPKSPAGKARRLRRKCTDCAREHRDIFLLVRVEHGRYKDKEWELIVKRIVNRWGKFVEEHCE